MSTTVHAIIIQHRKSATFMTETIYDALRDSHENQRSLLRRLLRSKPGSQRMDLWRELCAELNAHEAAEERYLYVPILMDDMGLSSSRHALHEHHEIDELIEDIRKLDPAGEPWLVAVKHLSKRVHHHLHEEERKFFQVSGKILNATQKTRLASRYRKEHARMLQTPTQ